MPAERSTRTDRRPWAARVAAAAEDPRVLCAIPLAYLVMDIVGTVRAYTPVPTHDMWEAALLSYLRALENGFLGETFSFWNEHRIVLSKLLFWLDFGVFDARLAFLTIANLLLLLLLWLALCALGRKLISSRETWLIASAGLSALSLSWLQRENLDSPFQSQFILAYLVPLLAFLAMAKALSAPERVRWLVAAMALGTASLGTMANGLLVFPLLLLMQGLNDIHVRRVRWLRLGILFLTGAILTALWLKGYASTATAVPTAGAFLSFAATFIGFPFADLAGSAAVGVLGALIYVAALLFIVLKRWRRLLEPHGAALLALIGFVLATAALTAYGRAADLANAALVSRYATPSLLAWAALALLFADAFQGRADANRIFARGGVALALIFLPAQVLRPLGDAGPALVHGSRWAALAFELDIPDPKATARIFHVQSSEQYEVLRDIAGQLAASHKSIFADPMWADAIGRLGGPASPGYRACENTVESIASIPGHDRYRLVHGWAVDLATWRQPRFVYFAAEGEIVGLAVRGMPRYDIFDPLYPRNGYRGFDGYVLSAHAGRFAVVCPTPE